MEKGNFEIVIADGFCSYKYQLFPKEGNNLSIYEVVKIIRKALSDKTEGFGEEIDDDSLLNEKMKEFKRNR